jgi:hypothetical protein
MELENSTQKNGQWTAIAITFAGVFLFATKAIIVKLGYREGMNAATMLLGHYVLGKWASTVQRIDNVRPCEDHFVGIHRVLPVQLVGLPRASPHLSQFGKVDFVCIPNLGGDHFRYFL